MNRTMIHYHPTRHERAMKPLLGGLAVLATAATLGLLVAGPAALAPVGDAAVLARATPAPVEVAIVPATIEVVGKRYRASRSEPSGFMPAALRTR